MESPDKSASDQDLCTRLRQDKVRLSEQFFLNLGPW